MRHVTDGVLRRLVDEPLAVPDKEAEHVQRCTRCQAHRERVVRDAGAARELLGGLQPVPDVERAWAEVNAVGVAPGRHVPKRIRPRRVVGTTGAAVATAVLVAGAAAAATLTVVFSPTHVAPLPVSAPDLQGLTRALGLGGTAPGLWQAASTTSRSTSGSTSAGLATGASVGAGTRGAGTLPRTWSYGTIAWGSRPEAVTTTSLGRAESVAGLAVTLPATLPAGVQGPPTFVAVPRSTVSVTFGAKAGPSLAGSTLSVTVGGAVLARYGDVDAGAGALHSLPTLAVATLARPTATSNGATLAQLEAFVLGRPGFPESLAAEIRLLGNPARVLPVPVPSSMSRTSTSVDGAPAVLVTAAGGVASGVVWEHDGTVRTVGGLLSGQDVMDVARQLG